MYASIRDATVIDGGYPIVAEGLKALGVDAIEAEFNDECAVRDLNTTDGWISIATPEGVAQYKKHLEKNGVRVSAFLLANDLNNDDMKAEIEWSAVAIRAAYALGIKAVRIDSAMSGQQELPFDERVQKFVDGIKAIIAETSDTPVDMGIENHGFQGNDPNFLHGVFDGVGSDRIGMTLDTGNFYWRGHPMDKTLRVIEEFAPLAKHTHVKNINYPEEMRNIEREMGWEYGKYVSPIPEGDVDHNIVVGFLKAAGYDRDLCCEDESLGKFETVAEKNRIVKADVDYLKQLAG
jgi:sugar phosphate isomerase/epimerase